VVRQACRQAIRDSPGSWATRILVGMTGSSIPTRHNLVCRPRYYLVTPGKGSSRNWIDFATGFPSLIS
jgi:hypothetical protein